PGAGEDAEARRILRLAPQRPPGHHTALRSLPLRNGAGRARILAGCLAQKKRRPFVPSLTFLLIAWFSPAEEAKRPICSGFLRFQPERKGVYTNRPENGPAGESGKSVAVED